MINGEFQKVLSIVIEREIAFHAAHPGKSSDSAEFERGFIAGLKQVRDGLLPQVCKALEGEQ